MPRRGDEPEERVSLVLKRELALWLLEMKERGFIGSNSEAIRFGLILLIDHFRKLGITPEK